MSMKPKLDWKLFPPNQDHVLSQQKLLYAFEALVRADQEELRAHPQIPLIYESGCVYKEEPPGHEDWADIPTVMQNRWGDCEDLAGWLCAELRVVWGIPCKPFLRFRKKGGNYHYHALVILPNGYKWDWEIVKEKGQTVIGTDGRPILKRVRKPIFRAPFVFEDPSARLGMGNRPFTNNIAYPQILKKATDPLAKKAAIAKRLGLLKARKAA